MPSRTLRAAPLCATLLLLAALPLACAQAQNCRNPVQNCDAATNYFPADQRISIDYATETIPELVYSNVYVDMTVNFSVTDKTTGASSPEVRKYRLIKCGCTAPVPKDRATVYLNPTAIYVDDSVSIGMIDTLDPELSAIKYIGNAKYKYNKDLRDKVRVGSITENKTDELNDDPNLSAFVENKLNAKSAVPSANPPVLIVAETDEHSPIARAEWIKIIGLYLNRENAATTLFNSIVSDYNEVVRRAKAATRRPSVFFNVPDTPDYGEAKKSVPLNDRYGWPQPGGNTYMSQFMRDANADYRFREDGQEGSPSITLDEIKGNFSSAHFLINADFLPSGAGRSMKDFVTQSKEGENIDTELQAFLSGLMAVRCGNVISRSLRIVETSNTSNANDFFESAVIRPDLLLKDYVKMLHPNVDVGTHNPVFVYKYSEDRSLGLECPFATLLGEPRPGTVYVDKVMDVKGMDRHDLQDQLEAKVFPELEKQGVDVKRTDIQFPDAGNVNEETTRVLVRREVADDKKDDAQESDAVLTAFRAGLGEDVEVEELKTSDNTEANDDGGGLGTSAIIGIVTGCVFGALFIILGLVLLLRKKQTKPDQYAEMETMGEHPVTS